MWRLEGSGHDDNAEHRRRVLLQVCDLLAIGTMFAFAAVYALVDAAALARPALLSLACVPFYGLSAWLNRKGRALAAKLLFFATLGGSILASTYFLVGKAPGLHFYLLLVSALPILLWSLKKWPYILAVMLLSLGAFVLVQYRADEPEALRAAFPAAWTEVFGISTVLTVYLMSLLIMAVFQRRSEADALALGDRARTMEELMRKYEELSNTDPLTGLLNRRAMTLRMEEERGRMSRSHAAFALLLCDIDHFKAVNDRHGHEAGDRVLVGVAEILRSSVREIDRVSRWGGEEFLLLLSDTAREGAAVVAERIRAKVEAAEFSSSGQALGCTVTVGIAVHSLERADLDECLRRADEALYRGKAAGRNRVVLAAEPS